MNTAVEAHQLWGQLLSHIAARGRWSQSGAVYGSSERAAWEAWQRTQSRLCSLLPLHYIRQEDVPAWEQLVVQLDRADAWEVAAAAAFDARSGAAAEAPPEEPPASRQRLS